MLPSFNDNILCRLDRSSKYIVEADGTSKNSEYVLPTVFSDLLLISVISLFFVANFQQRHRLSAASAVSHFYPSPAWHMLAL